ncbi:MAG: SNF2-related protein [Elusimicrobiota bacterium]
MELKEFISDWKDVLTKKVVESFTPIYQFEQKAGSNSVLSSLKRKLLPSQEHIALAIRRYLSKNKTAFIVGEMGVGKTILSVGISALLKSSDHSPLTDNRSPITALIMCPSHLCKKWEREIKKTLDNSAVFQITSITDFETALSTVNRQLSTFFILSKETAKLSYEWKPSAIYEPNRRDGNCFCPDCGTLLIDTENEIPLRFTDLYNKKPKCHKCGGALWQSTRLLKGKGKARYSLAKYIHDKYKRFFDLLVIDEAHQYKASGSAQGQSMSLLVSSAKKVLTLTGTIFGGRSTSLFYILYRLTHSVKEKYEFRAEKEWAKRYGIIQRITKAKENEYSSDGHSSSSREYRTLVRELPGASPDIINFLLDKTAFFKLSDLGVSLPKYTEAVIESKMEKEHQQEYEKLESFLLDEIRSVLHQRKRDENEPKNPVNIGLYLQMLLTYPDQPFRNYNIINTDGLELYSAKKFNESTIYPKEQKLIELVKTELSQKRNVWIYCTHTHNRDITDRLQKILLAEGITSAILKQSVNARKREEWIAKQVSASVRVVISNPRLVETGLDLIDFPTLVFFETEYSTYTLRQSSRRSWRIGQKQPVKVFYFCYADTIQQKALSLVAKKIKSAMMVDGDVIFEGTVAEYKDEGNFFMELARDIIDASDVDDLSKIFNEVANTESQGNEFLLDHQIEIEPVMKPITEHRAPPTADIPTECLIKNEDLSKYIQQELFSF